jgi:F-type H+-transporting ATPase subunit gamma
LHAAPRAVLLEGFMRQLLFVGIYRALTGSLAAEHYMRMVAMGAAENNIEEHLEKIRLEYQTRRQAEITSELIDVVVGAEASASERRRAAP